MKAIRLFLLAALLFVGALEPVAAQEPVTLTGEINDGGVTRTITLTLIFTPVEISSYEPVYTTALSTGSEFVVGRSATYGQIIAGAAGLLGLLAFTFAIVAGMFNGSNG